LKVLVACESSGRVRHEFQKAGHTAWSCDLKPNEMGHDLWHYQCDVREVLSGHARKFDLLIAHPDCTYLTNSGVRWLHEKEGRWAKLEEAARFYAYLWSQPIPRICIENPVMHRHANTMLSLIGLPKRQFVQPWWFGDPMFKCTGYALKNLPQLVPTNKLTPPKAGTDEHKAWSWVHRCPPGPDRATIRSRTPVGIARAMAQQWGGAQLQSEVA